MSEFLEGVGKLIIFCVVVGFLDGIATTYCCSAVVFVRFVCHEVDFTEEPVVIGDRLKNFLHLFLSLKGWLRVSKGR